MKRAMTKRLLTHRQMFIGELERSGIKLAKSVKRNLRRESSLRDPRSEFHRMVS